MTLQRISLSQLWRYPVKSMGGESLVTCEVTQDRLALDRSLGVYTENGKIGSGKDTRRFARVPGLLEYRSEVRDDTAWVCTPTGQWHRADDPLALADLCETLATPLAIRPQTTVSHLDAGAVHIVSSSTIAWLETHSGPGQTARRLRPNLVLETGDLGSHVEESWIGRELRIGEVRLEVTDRTERCVMIGEQQGELPKVAGLVKTVARENAMCLGVYAKVLATGALHVGDEAMLVP